MNWCDPICSLWAPSCPDAIFDTRLAQQFHFRKRLQMNREIAGIVFYLFTSLVWAQEVSDANKRPPSTKLEAFSSRTGAVLVKGFSNVGTVSDGRGTVSIDAREFRDAGNPKAREYGITIEVKEAGRLERENTSFIDADEVDSLLRGIDYISKADKSITTLNDFEATYKTKGDFTITTFSYSGRVDVAVSSGRIGKSSAYLKLADLEQIKALIMQAKAKADAARVAAK